jgi:hypothetical protein
MTHSPSTQHHLMIMAGSVPRLISEKGGAGWQSSDGMPRRAPACMAKIRRASGYAGARLREMHALPSSRSTGTRARARSGTKSQKVTLGMGCHAAGSPAESVLAAGLSRNESSAATGRAALPGASHAGATSTNLPATRLAQHQGLVSQWIVWRIRGEVQTIEASSQVTVRMPAVCKTAPFALLPPVPAASQPSFRAGLWGAHWNGCSARIKLIYAR